MHNSNRVSFDMDGRIREQMVQGQVVGGHWRLRFGHACRAEQLSPRRVDFWEAGHPQLASVDKLVRPQVHKEEVNMSGTWVKDIKELEYDMVDGTPEGCRPRKTPRRRTTSTKKWRKESRHDTYGSLNNQTDWILKHTNNTHVPFRE